MSRLGKQPSTIPAGVTVTCDNGLLTVAGPKGTLTREIKPDVTISIADGVATVTPGKTVAAKALWGTYAAHLRNMIKGVTEGYTKVLEIEGVGYKAEVKGTNLSLNVGFSHPVLLPIPSGVTATVEKGVITVSSFDKDLLGQFAANVRKVKEPEPYKGKGIRYQGEYIIRKQGKKAA
ncbi:MAG TPA: 50S ribosomal protein L6 [Candidatus Paceibacterota bacterium]|nr:50S ribosomal protein L6 [Candidatus Paceibacterota bacterium]